MAKILDPVAAMRESAAMQCVHLPIGPHANGHEALIVAASAIRALPLPQWTAEQWVALAKGAPKVALAWQRLPDRAVRWYLLGDERGRPMRAAFVHIDETEDMDASMVLEDARLEAEGVLLQGGPHCG